MVLWLAQVGFSGVALIDCLCDLEGLLGNAESEVPNAAEAAAGAARGLFRTDGTHITLCTHTHYGAHHSTEWPKPIGDIVKAAQTRQDKSTVAAAPGRGVHPPGVTEAQTNAAPPSSEETALLLERLLLVEGAHVPEDELSN